MEDGASVEVVPASQFAHGLGDWREKAWISESLGLAVTSAAFDKTTFRTSGALHVWSLRTGQVLRTIDTPARVQMIAGDGHTPTIFVAGGPTHDAEAPDDEEFVWMLDLETGRKRELPPHGSYNIDDGSLSKDGTKLVLNNDVIYDLENLDQPPRRGVPIPDLLVESEKESLRQLPNWLYDFGASDGRLVLGRVKNRAAVWRNDTGEELMSLGSSGVEVDAWTPSADGTTLLGVRSTGSAENSAHLILDMQAWKVTEWSEPRLANSLGSVQPVLTNDGRIVRFGRMTGDGQMEIVSRDWRSGEERVDLSVAVAKLDVHTWPKVAAFSSDGMALAVAGSKRGVVVRWESPGLSQPRVSEHDFRTKNIVGITCDGATVYYLTERVDQLHYYVHAREVSSGRDTRVMECATVEFTLQGVFQSLPGVAGETLSARGDFSARFKMRPSADSPWRDAADTGKEASALRSGAFVRTRDGRSLLVQFRDSSISTHDADSGRQLGEFRSDKFFPNDIIHERMAAPLAGRIFAALDYGGVQILDVLPDGELKPVAQFWSPAPGSWLAVLPDGRYAASPHANPPVFFRSGGRLYPFEEFDAEFNQPDAVAEALGALPPVVEELRTQRTQRQARLRLPDKPPGPGQRPSVRLRASPPLRHDHPALTIEGTAQAADAAGVALDLWVNDVPVFGVKGRPLEVAAKGTADFLVEIPLVPGANKVQFALRDAVGGVSLRETFLVHRSAHGAAPRRFVLAIGVSDYDDDGLDLNYAAKDARDVAVALTSVTGRFSDTRSLVLTDQQARREGILAAKDFLRQTRPEDEVVIFLAGHGGVNNGGEYFFCAADSRLDDPSTGLSYSELENLFDGIPALARLLLIDSCHSGELTEDQVLELTARFSGGPTARGVRARSAGPARASVPGDGGALRRANEMFLDLRRTTGATVLSASGGLEFAYETEEAGNGLFTHSLVSALTAPVTDADHDGEVTASELIQATARSVEQLTGGQQRPNARFTNRAVDFPIASGQNAAIPGIPEDVVRHFVDWTASPWWDGSMNPRLGTCFAPEILYFGKAQNFAAIEAAPSDFKERFPLHHDSRASKIKRLVPSHPDSDGAVTVQCDISYHVPSFGKFSPDNRFIGNSPERFGELSVEAVLRPMAHEWKIVSLRTLADAQVRDGKSGGIPGRAPQQPAAPSVSGGESVWVFSDSGERLLNSTEIKRLTADERWRARNEIYARRGLIFSTAKGKAFARSLGAAYRPVTSDPDAIERGFNSFERKNVHLIKSIENGR